MPTNVLLLFLGLQVILVVFFWVFVIKRHVRMSYVYPLYEARDKFISLVATGKLREDDFLFQYFYKAINIVIPNSKHITLNHIITAVVNARKKGYDPSENIKKIREELSRINDREVEEATKLYYHAVLYLLLKNSTVLSLSDSLKIASSVPRITAFQKTTWDIFRDYRNAYSQVRCAV